MKRSGNSDEPFNESSSRQVSIEDYVCTRDSVVTGLASLQSAIQDLSRAYIAHTNTIIAKGSGSSPGPLNLTVPLRSEDTLFGARLGTLGSIQEPVEAKKRKRAPHDKNAPKRPLTPYFLYMQTARSQIASELDQGHAAKEVADEGRRRWNDMSPEEKERWSYQYGINLARYREKVKAYKAGRPIPEISDTEAKKLYEDERNVGLIPERSHRELEPHTDPETSLPPSSDEDSPEPPRAPSPPKSLSISKRRKGGKDPNINRPSFVSQTNTRDGDLISSQLVNSLSETERKKRPTRKKEFKGVNETPDTKDVKVAVTSSPKRDQDSVSKVKKSKRKRKSEMTET